MATTTYTADRTALLIVDSYNDFMSEGDKLYEATRKTAEAVGFCDNMRKLIPGMRPLPSMRKACTRRIS
jgi:nicotinamidase-related amidase